MQRYNPIHVRCIRDVAVATFGESDVWVRSVDLLLSLLGRLPPDEAELLAEEVGAEYGRAMADARGFAAHTDGHHEELRIIDDHCPFGHVAIEHPVICAVDRGMIRGMLGTLVGDPIDELTTEASFARGDTFCVTTV